MNQRAISIPDQDDTFFTDWLLDLHSLEGATGDDYDVKVWSGVQSTFVQSLVRSN
jgi:hypothetical protein